MKNKVLLLLLIFCSAADGFSQQYHPFPTDSATWRQMSAEWSYPNRNQDDYNYYYQGDTLILGENYHKVYKTGYYSEFGIASVSGPLVLISGPDLMDTNLYIGAIREDALKHIYFFSDTANSEKLLYDFNLTVGDTLPPAVNDPNLVNIITSIDSVYTGTGYHKRYNIGVPGSTAYNYGSIIEGVGSSFGLLEMPYPIFENSSTLQCFRVKGDVVYSDGISPNCNLLMDIREAAQNAMVTVFPNPSSGLVTIRLPFTEKTEIEIFDVLGKTMYADVITAAESTFNLDHLSKGFYFLRISSNNRLIANQKIVLK